MPSPRFYDNDCQPISERLVSLTPYPVIAESALDRLVSCSRIITLTGKSYRSLLHPSQSLVGEVATV